MADLRKQVEQRLINKVSIRIHTMLTLILGIAIGAAVTAYVCSNDN